MDGQRLEQHHTGFSEPSRETGKCWRWRSAPRVRHFSFFAVQQGFNVPGLFFWHFAAFVLAPVVRQLNVEPWRLCVLAKTSSLDSSCCLEQGPVRLESLELIRIGTSLNQIGDHFTEQRHEFETVTTAW
jgi:hypothetical protein